MKQNVTLYMMEQAFRDAGRATAFTYEGLKMLHSGIEQMEDDTGMEVEFDVIGFCCEFDELTYEEIMEQYDIEGWGGTMDDEETRETVLNFLQDQTWVLGYDENIVVFQQF